MEVSITPKTVIYACPVTGRSYDFAQLRLTTEQFGSGLRTHFAWGKDDVMAIFSHNCIDTPAITWGCHWAGGIVSPANPGYTVRELVHHLKDSGAKALFTQKKLLPVALRAAAEAGIESERVVLIGDREERSEKGPRHFSDLLDRKPKGTKTTIDPKQDLAYLVYSSGTTGLPKGVMLTHNNVVSGLLMLNNSEGSIFKWNNDRILAVLPFYHIYGTISILPILVQSWLIDDRTSMPGTVSCIQWHHHNRDVLLQPQGLLLHHPRSQDHIYLRRSPDSRSSRKESGGVGL